MSLVECLAGENYPLLGHTGNHDPLCSSARLRGLAVVDAIPSRCLHHSSGMNTDSSMAPPVLTSALSENNTKLVLSRGHGLCLGPLHANLHLHLGDLLYGGRYRARLQEIRAVAVNSRHSGIPSLLHSCQYLVSPRCGNCEATYVPP